MAGEPNADEKAARGRHPNKPTGKPSGGFWRWFILHAERKMHQRRAHREKEKSGEKPEDRAARLTATATVWIAIFTVVLAGVGVLTLFELIEGGADTKALVTASKQQANAASDQADAAQQFSDTAEDINGRMSDAVDQLQSTAENTKRTIKNAENSFRAEQRAWVGVAGIADNKGFTDTEPWQITVVFFNSGRTPARNAQISSMFITSRTELSGPPSDSIKLLTSFTPVQSIAPQGYYRLTIGKESAGEIVTGHQRVGAKILISQYNLIKTRQLFLYYFGILKYDDAFGKQHQTQYCALLADPATKDAGICDSFNDLN